MEWITETQWLWWIGAALVLGLIEIASLDLVFSMLAVAALTAAGAAAVGVGFPIQVVVFVVAAMILLLLLRPVLLRRLRLDGEAPRTNADANVGLTAEVLQNVTQRSGLVKLRGEDWSARTEATTEIAQVGQVVDVIRIDGATAVVAPRSSTADPPPTDTHPPA